MGRGGSDHMPGEQVDYLLVAGGCWWGTAIGGVKTQQCIEPTADAPRCARSERTAVSVGGRVAGPESRPAGCLTRRARWRQQTLGFCEGGIGHRWRAVAGPRVYCQVEVVLRWCCAAQVWRGAAVCRRGLSPITSRDRRRHRAWRAAGAPGLPGTDFRLEQHLAARPEGGQPRITGRLLVGAWRLERPPRHRRRPQVPQQAQPPRLRELRAPRYPPPPPLKSAVEPPAGSQRRRFARSAPPPRVRQLFVARRTARPARRRHPPRRRPPRPAPPFMARGPPHAAARHPRKDPRTARGFAPIALEFSFHAAKERPRRRSGSA
ncbi:hypothetical protein DFJ74DRAFT_191618 [Hyaloraphidium curvatum]|nr:hypothetical protein DFJ74DRAFT_191618 [Hyaloraphidium curvatum]